MRTVDMQNFKDARPVARAGFTASLLLVYMLGFCSSATAATKYCVTNTPCGATPACPGTGTGPVDLSGQTLTNLNFANKPHTYLVGANLSNTTLIGVNFSGLDLTNANFSGARARANKDGILTDFTNTLLDGTCFTGAVLSGADLQFATFKQTDFTCARLLNAKFGPLVAFEGGTTQRTKFNYSKVGIARSGDSYLFPLDRMSEISPSFWSKTDFTCAHLVGLDKTNFRPAGRTMTSAILRGVVLDGFEFYNEVTKTGVNLDHADLTGISLRGAGLVSASLDGVKLVGADLTQADFSQALFHKTDETIHSDLTRAVLNGSTLNQARLAHVTLSGAQLNGVQAEKASFENSTMQATPDDNVASVINSDFSGATFAHAALNNVTFSRCTLTAATMHPLTLSRTSFQDSTMVGAMFYGAELQDVNFTGAQLNNVSFDSAKLKAELTGAGVNFTCSQLGGANFSSTELFKANFAAAVMPPDSQCCPQVGSGFFCGYAVNGDVYGQTTLPEVGPTSVVTCPNGMNGGCSGRDWVIPGWKTTLCGDGREQVVWRKPVCGDQPLPETVTIDDPNLKTCVQDALFDGVRQPITKEAAATLVFLNCPGRGIADLKGLTKSNFPALKTLDLSTNQLAGTGDFSQFSENLQTIKLSYNKYTLLVFSWRQKDLKYLEASNNQITAVQVSADTYLRHIDLSHNKLAGTQDFFAQRDNEVRYLDLSFNSISSIGSASVLQQAGVIYLHSNNLTTIGSVKDLWADDDGTLYYLTLDANACFQCGTLGVDRATSLQFGCTCDPRACPVCN